MSELVQPILVTSDCTHEDAVLAVAIAASTLWRYDKDDSCWAEWLSGPFTKTVRRLKPAKFHAFYGNLEEGQRFSVVKLGSASALALRPMSMQDFPSTVAKAQVQGTDFPRTEWEVLSSLTDASLTDPQTPTLLLNPALAESMSTGKTAAQAAHALMALALLDETVTLSSVRVYTAATPELFNEAKITARVVIADAGRTELEPGTVTFLAF